MPDLKTADQLIHQISQRTFVRNAAFNAFRHQFAVGSLPVTVRISIPIAPKLAHTAIAFEGAPLVENRLARALVRASQQAADHYRIRAGGYRLGDVAGVLDAAIGNQGHAGFASGFRRIPKWQ